MIDSCNIFKPVVRYGFSFLLYTQRVNFELVTDKKPAGDQPAAIAALMQGYKKGLKHQTLLGVTGSGKTFTGANIIQQIQKPKAL